MSTILPQYLFPAPTSVSVQPVSGSIQGIRIYARISSQQFHLLVSASGIDYFGPSYGSFEPTDLRDLVSVMQLAQAYQQSIRERAA